MKQSKKDTEVSLIQRNQYNLDVQFDNDNKQMFHNFDVEQLINQYKILTSNENTLKLATLNFKDKPKNFKL